MDETRKAGSTDTSKSFKRMSESFTDSELRWYCLRSKAKREHIVASQVSQLEGTDVFCPRVRFKKSTRRGKIVWVEAMFPGYFFAKFNFYQRSKEVSHNPGVIGFVRFGDHIPSLSDQAIEGLRSIITDEDQQVVDIQPKVSKGDEVELAEGVLKGMTGEVVEIIPSHERVVVLMEFLGEKKKVEVDVLSLLLPRRPC